MARVGLEYNQGILSPLVCCCLLHRPRFHPSPLFPDLSLALDHMVVYEREARERMQAWVP